jgi:hypothetical protein
MRNWDNPITDYWLKYYLDPESGLCSLCGNTGKIDIEAVRTPYGKLLKAGCNCYCICPNGQSLRKNRDKE